MAGGGRSHMPLAPLQEERQETRQETRQDERSAPRRMPPPRLHALSRAYWPAGTRLPYLRLAIGVAVAPWPVAAVTSVLVWRIYALTENNETVAWALTLEAAALTLYGLYLIAILGGAVAIPYLWATRRRAAMPWIAAGASAGAIIVLASGWAQGESPDMTPYAAAMVLGAGTFLTIRWIAGVRIAR